MIVYFREQKTFTGKSQTWLTKFWTQEHLEPAASCLHTLAMHVIPRASSFPWEGMSRDLWMTWKSFFSPYPPILLVPRLLCIWEEATSKGISLVLQTEHSRNESQCSRQTSHCSITKHGEVGTNTQFWSSSFRSTVYLCGMYYVFNILFKRAFLRVHFHIEMYISLSVRTVKKSNCLPQIIIFTCIF